MSLLRKEEFFCEDRWRNSKSKEREHGIVSEKIKFTTTIRKVRKMDKWSKTMEGC